MLNFGGVYLPTPGELMNDICENPHVQWEIHLQMLDFPLCCNVSFSESIK